MRKIVPIALVVLCVAAWASLIGTYLKQDDAYQYSLSQARAMAKRGVPYRAAALFNTALSEVQEQEVYNEYLEQLYNLNHNSVYYDALKQYVEAYPSDTQACEKLQQYYYDKNDTQSLLQFYRQIQKTASTTPAMDEQYKEVFYTVKTISSGYDNAASFVGQYAVVSVNKKWGIIGSEGQTVVKTVWDDIDCITGTAFPVADDTGSYRMNLNGEKDMVPSQPVDKIYSLSGNVCVVAKDGRYAISDTALNIPDEFPYEYLSTAADNVMAAKKDGKWALISPDGSQITDYIYEDILIDPDRNTCISNGVVFAKQNGKYILLNAKGKQIGSEQFDEAKGFASSQPAAVRVGEKWGFVNADGTINGAIKYEEVGSFSLGMYAAAENGKWGYKTPSGEFVIPAVYDECKPFSSNGIAAVRVGDTWSYITLLGFK